MVKKEAYGVGGAFFSITHNKIDNKWQLGELEIKAINNFEDKEKAIQKAALLSKDCFRGHIIILNEEGNFEAYEGQL